MVKAWNELGDNIFTAWLNTREDGSGELWAENPSAPEMVSVLDQHAAVFLRAVKESMDAAVLATAQVVCTPLWPVDPDLHQMPLMMTSEDFDALIPNGYLLGLRPDQVRTLRTVQPFTSDGSGEVFVGAHMRHLAAALDALKQNRPLACSWATCAGPDLRPPDKATLTRIKTELDGPLAHPRVLATFQIDPPRLVGQVKIIPNVALDLVLAASPRPKNPDDNFQARSSALLVIAKRLIDGLERSVSTPTFIQQFGRLDDLTPVTTRTEWRPVDFRDANQESEAREGLAGSDLNLASLRGEDGTYTLLRLQDDRVVGRAIPKASPPEVALSVGPGAELATLKAAARWGLPDLVFNAKVVAKGSGLREIGDGTLVADRRGIALQVKARNAATTNQGRESSWLRKQAGEGLRQAHGTIRTTLSLCQ